MKKNLFLAAALSLGFSQARAEEACVPSMGDLRINRAVMMDYMSRNGATRYHIWVEGQVAHNNCAAVNVSVRNGLQSYSAPVDASGRFNFFILAESNRIEANAWFADPKLASQSKALRVDVVATK